MEDKNLQLREKLRGLTWASYGKRTTRFYYRLQADGNCAFLCSVLLGKNQTELSFCTGGTLSNVVYNGVVEIINGCQAKSRGLSFRLIRKYIDDSAGFDGSGTKPALRDVHALAVVHFLRAEFILKPTTVVYYRGENSCSITHQPKELLFNFPNLTISCKAGEGYLISGKACSPVEFWDAFHAELKK